MNATRPTSTSTSAIPVMIRITRNSMSIGPANVEAAGGSHQDMGRLLLALPRGEGEGGRLALRPRYRDGGRLRAELLVPRFDGIRPGRQALDCEAAIRPRNGVERMGLHAHVRLHPAMYEIGR